MSDEDLTTISIKKSTRERLRAYGQKGTTWDKLLNELMTEVDTLSLKTERSLNN